MIDLTNHVEIQDPIKISTKTILTAYFRLDKKTMVSLLSAEKIYVNGDYYKVPEHTILHCLINQKYGDTKLELEQIT
jgi:ATP sulfurylase